MDQLVQSIKRTRDNHSCHAQAKRRWTIRNCIWTPKKACELAGFETVKAEVREMTRDDYYFNG